MRWRLQLLSSTTPDNYSSWDYASRSRLMVISMWGTGVHAILRPLKEVTAAVARALGETSIWEISSGAAQGGGWRIGNTPGKGGVREEEEPEIDMPPATPRRRGAAKDERKRESPQRRLERRDRITAGARRARRTRVNASDNARKARQSI